MIDILYVINTNFYKCISDLKSELVCIKDQAKFRSSIKLSKKDYLHVPMSPKKKHGNIKKTKNQGTKNIFKNLSRIKQIMHPLKNVAIQRLSIDKATATYIRNKNNALYPSFSFQKKSLLHSKMVQNDQLKKQVETSCTKNKISQNYK